jgi:hypothetical protein
MEIYSFDFVYDNVAVAPRHELRCRVRGRLLDVELYSSNAALFDEVRERIAPYVEVDTDPDAPMRNGWTAKLGAPTRVMARVGDVLLPHESGEPIMIREHPQFEHFCRPGLLWQRADRILVLERKNGSLVAAEPHRAWVTNPDAGALAKSTRRLLQDLLRLGAAQRRRLVVKGAALRAGSLPIVFMGETGAGKTTVLGRALEKFGGALVANTEFAIGFDPLRQTVAVHGMPSYVMVRPDMLAHMPRLRPLAEFLPGDDPKAPVTYWDFARAFGGTVLAEIEDPIIVFLTATRDPTERLVAKEVEGRLLSAMRYGPEWRTPWRLCAPGSRVTAGDSAQLARQLSQAVRAIRMGRNRSVSELIDAVRRARDEWRSGVTEGTQ